ncbi:helix-turn-helix transcriptional regulator [Nocardia tengchongensis]|uniref:Helix-turn-helix transcriptional regulator n=1 Tax=Nocardia tengchongensis TaxID=2055889 RepID=A0ABX8CPR0_9NOCA|nr:helix-turn-helix domain-containing protein [Nocardia tengchongensis]QVI20859.1 helix-turn-helix transcriptional regulator [Nocardia tengchongensis]
MGEVRDVTGDQQGPGRGVSVDEILERAGEVREAFDTIANTWSLLILVALREGTLRYNELKRTVGGVSERRLSQTLKLLERDGVVDRNLVRSIPSHVEYSLTPTGEAVVDSLGGLLSTIIEFTPQVAAARQRYDRKHARTQDSAARDA